MALYVVNGYPLLKLFQRVSKFNIECLRNKVKYIYIYIYLLSIMRFLQFDLLKCQNWEKQCLHYLLITAEFICIYSLQ